jgi:hypothetical protein
MDFVVQSEIEIEHQSFCYILFLYEASSINTPSLTVRTADNKTFIVIA